MEELRFYCQVCDTKMPVKKRRMEINEPVIVYCSACNAVFELVFDGSVFALKFVALKNGE